MWSIRKVQMPQTSQTTSPTFPPSLWSLFPCPMQPQPLLAWCWSISSSDLIQNLCKPFYHINITLQVPLTPHKPSGGYLPKLSAADTHHIQQLISSWKAVNAAQIIKAPVYTKNKPLIWYNVHFNPKKADLRAMLKRKCHFSVCGIGWCG